ncbi:MAG: hypothetical protein EBZ78_08755 [Verrucomicrobia bacterium]|nr:hypothetical protein [Verrucomicrobiota bacterium]
MPGLRDRDPKRLPRQAHPDPVWPFPFQGAGIQNPERLPFPIAKRLGQLHLTILRIHHPSQRRVVHLHPRQFHRQKIEPDQAEIRGRIGVAVLGDGDVVAGQETGREAVGVLQHRKELVFKSHRVLLAERRLQRFGRVHVLAIDKNVAHPLRAQGNLHQIGRRPAAVLQGSHPFGHEVGLKSLGGKRPFGDLGQLEIEVTTRQRKNCPGLGLGFQKLARPLKGLVGAAFHLGPEKLCVVCGKIERSEQQGQRGNPRSHVAWAKPGHRHPGDCREAKSASHLPEGPGSTDRADQRDHLEDLKAGHEQVDRQSDCKCRPAPTPPGPNHG